MTRFFTVVLLLSLVAVGFGIPPQIAQLETLSDTQLELKSLETQVQFDGSPIFHRIIEGKDDQAGQTLGDTRSYIEQNGLTYEQANHPAFAEHQLRIMEPKLCDPSVQQYSGYLDVSEGRHLFFWFFEARTSPETAPLILWLNGGPGCTSTSGLLFELGPCSVANGGKNTTYNPHSWNEHANIIFLDQPTGVGYSYSSDGSSSNTSPDVARDVYAFFEIFFRRYPKYASLPLHVAAESYGGHYAPNIAHVIHKKNLELGENPSLIRINLDSIILGNGLTDPYIQFGSTPEYACGGPYPIFQDPDGKECVALKRETRICQRLIKACSMFNTKLACVPANFYCLRRVFGPIISNPTLNPYDARKTCDTAPDKDGVFCYKEYGWVEEWMRDSVRKRELGVAPETKYEACSDSVSRAFHLNGDGVRNSALLVRELVDNGIRVMVYAGNTDQVCNVVGEERWMLALETKFTEEFASSPTLPWITLNSGGMAGEVRSAGPGAGNYTFVNVHEAGHMAPYDQPMALLDLITRWISNEPLSL